jgi:hypothetical protein
MILLFLPPLNLAQKLTLTILFFKYKQEGCENLKEEINCLQNDLLLVDGSSTHPLNQRARSDLAKRTVTQNIRQRNKPNWIDGKPSNKS